MYSVCVRVCMCAWLCTASVSLPYQSASAVLICQNIFPLMCSDLWQRGGGRGRGGWWRFVIASKLLRKTFIYLSRFPVMGRNGRGWVVRSRAGTHRERRRNHENSTGIKHPTHLSNASACFYLHSGRERAEASQGAGCLGHVSWIIIYAGALSHVCVQWMLALWSGSVRCLGYYDMDLTY